MFLILLHNNSNYFQKMNPLFGFTIGGLMMLFVVIPGLLNTIIVILVSNIVTYFFFVFLKKFT